jgi:hypothetical protein
MTTGQEMEHCLKDMVHSKQRYGFYNDVTTTNTTITMMLLLLILILLLLKGEDWFKVVEIQQAGTTGFKAVPEGTWMMYNQNGPLLRNL